MPKKKSHHHSFLGSHEVLRSFWEEKNNTQYHIRKLQLNMCSKFISLQSFNRSIAKCILTHSPISLRTIHGKFINYPLLWMPLPKWIVVLYIISGWRINLHICKLYVNGSRLPKIINFQLFTLDIKDRFDWKERKKNNNDEYLITFEEFNLNVNFFPFFFFSISFMWFSYAILLNHISMLGMSMFYTISSPANII